MTGMKHSIISASGSNRWLECPGSIDLSRGIPDTSSEAADEGTAAHTLAERCLLQNKNAAEFRGQTITVKDSGRAFIVDEEMAEAVQLYIDTIKADYEAMQPGATLSVEREFQLSWLHEDLFGTNDSSIEQMFGLLRAYDLKFGKGVVVEVEANTQMMIYALGALHDSTCEDVEVVIIQPRAEHDDGPVRRWRISTAELLEWAQEVLLPGAKLALSGKGGVYAGDWCRFCKAIAVCPAVRDKATQAAMVVFDDSPDAKVPTLPAPAEMAPEQLIKVMEFSRAFGSWAKEVETHVKNAMERGVQFPGWKLVRGKRSRSWENEGVTIHELNKGYGGKIYTEPKLRSPAQMEAMLKEAKVDIKTLESLIKVTRPLTMAPASDKRDAVVPAIEAFND